MKTDELIKSLRICQDLSKSCKDCNFGACDSGCLRRILSSAATRLEELTAELEAERYRHDRYVDFELDEAAELAKVKAERDALLADLKICHNCRTCKHDNDTKKCASDCEICKRDCHCYDCMYGDKWEWRGVMPNE